MVGGTLLAYLGGLHYWWPKITGKLYSEPWAKTVGGDRLRRLQPDVLPAVHPRLHGDAAPLPRSTRRSTAWQVLNVLSSAGASILAVGAHPAGDLPDLLVRSRGRPPGRIPWGANGPRVGDGVAAADRELRGHADRDRAGLRLHQRGRACLRSTPPWPRTATASPGAAAPLRHARAAAVRVSTFGMWVFLVTEVLFFGGLFMAYILYRIWYRDMFVAASHELNVPLGAVQHGGADRQLADDGAGGATPRRRGEPPRAGACC